MTQLCTDMGLWCRSSTTHMWKTYTKLHDLSIRGWQACVRPQGWTGRSASSATVDSGGISDVMTLAQQLC